MTLTHQERAVLSWLRYNPTPDTDWICRQTMTGRRALDDLVRKGLVTRGGHSWSRSVPYRVTEAGERALDGGHPITHPINRAVSHG